jgi:hypothetical protein
MQCGLENDQLKRENKVCEAAENTMEGNETEHPNIHITKSS